MAEANSRELNTISFACTVASLLQGDCEKIEILFGPFGPEDHTSSRVKPANRKGCAFRQRRITQSKRTPMCPLKAWC